MTQILQIGPLALPYALLVTLGAIAIGWFIGMRRARVAGADAEPLLMRMVLVGVIAARLAFVWQWRGPYLDEPLSILDIRDGGWDTASGLTAAFLYGLYRVRGQGTLRKPVITAVLATGAIWVLGSFALTLGSRDAVALPQLSLPSLQGPAVAMAGFVGKPTVVNLWASWCPPCRREMPVLRQAQAENPALNFVFVNQGETQQIIQSYLDQHRLVLKNVLVDARLQVGSALGQRALPTTLFFDARGQLVSTRIGELSQATLAQRLSELRRLSPAAR
ncbi:MAG: TlpA disulfide reductase family protein [Burkholderiaceae bacterium]